MKYLIKFKGVELEIEQLPNGKFKKPDLGLFTKQGLGSTWLGNGRIPYKSNDVPAGGYGRMGIEIGKPLEHQPYTPKKRGNLKSTSPDRKWGYKECVDIGSSEGRFPSHLIVSDDALNDGVSGHSTGHYSYQLKKAPYDGGWKSLKDKGYLKESNNSFSRYFSLDSWWEKRFKELPPSVQKTFPYLIVPKASKSEKNKGCEELYWEKDSSSFGYHQIDRKRWGQLEKEEERIFKETAKRATLQAKGNIHATVKPLKLMSYLITLGSRPGDTVLDPFLGSGTTAVAAKMLNRNFIAFEINPESCAIAKARLKNIQSELPLA